jgi:hypothetical protein
VIAAGGVKDARVQRLAARVQDGDVVDVTLTATVGAAVDRQARQRCGREKHVEIAAGAEFGMIDAGISVV